MQATVVGRYDHLCPAASRHCQRATPPAEIPRHNATLSDPGLYARDRKAFDRATANADRARALLAAAEEEWLELEAKREALASA